MLIYFESLEYGRGKRATPIYLENVSIVKEKDSANLLEGHDGSKVRGWYRICTDWEDDDCWLNADTLGEDQGVVDIIKLPELWWSGNRVRLFYYIFFIKNIDNKSLNVSWACD